VTVIEPVAVPLELVLGARSAPSSAKCIASAASSCCRAPVSRPSRVMARCSVSGPATGARSTA
jgi:hypothetical protein